MESPPDRLVCSICQFPCRGPHLSVCCGQVFCKSCLDGARKAAITTACSVCQDKEFITFPNKQADREIKSLHVMCTNKERGCEWQGELNEIINHLGNSDGCQFEDVKCSNECGKMLQRRYLTIHVEAECPCRNIDCQYCRITGEHQFIEGEHKEQCPKFPLPCPNKCEVGNVRREDKEEHRKKCPLEMVQCEYHNVGCEEKIMRKEMEKHNEEKLKDHLSLTKSKLAEQVEDTQQEMAGTQIKLADKFADVTKQLEGTQQELTSTQLKLANSESKLTDVMQQVEGTQQELVSTQLKLANSESKLADVTQQVEGTQRELASTQLKLANSESKLADITQQVEGTQQELVSTQLKLANSESKLADVTQQVEGTQQELASAQLKLADSEDRLRQQLELVTLGTNYHLANAFSQINTLMVALHHSAVTKGHASYTNGTTSVVSAAQWWAELMARAAVLKSRDQVCPVTLHIGFDGKKRLNNIQRYSDPFFSHDKGYKMCLQVDTVRSNTHLSVYLHLMKGPLDDELTWPLRGKFEVKLLNQISDCEHYSLALVYGDHIKDDYAAGRVKHGNKARGWGYTKFISKEDLRKVTPTCQYLKDDCIFLQVSKL